MKLIKDQFSKVEKIDAAATQSKRQLRDEDEEAKGGSGDMLADLPRQDCSKELNNSKLISKMMEKDWKKKNEGYKMIEEIIKKANNRIEAHGLHDMMGALKQGILDKNKNVLKTALGLTAKLAEAMGPGAKAYNKLIMVLVLENLADK